MLNNLNEGMSGIFNINNAAMLFVAKYVLQYTRATYKRILAYMVSTHGKHVTVESTTPDTMIQIIAWLKVEFPNSKKLFNQTLVSAVRNQPYGSYQMSDPDNMLNDGTYYLFKDKTMFTVNVSKDVSSQNKADVRYKMSVSLLGRNDKVYSDKIIAVANTIPETPCTKYILGNSVAYGSTVTRTFNSIFSPIKQEIIETVDRFMDNQDRIKTLEMQPKIAFMLHGVPGTGKTTIADAIATHVGGDVVRVTRLFRGIDNQLLTDAGVKPLVVLIDEIDILLRGNATDSDEHGNPIKINSNETTGIMLNFLDCNSGTFERPVIFVATTNNYDDLPDAIKRSRRFDKTINVGNINKESAIEMCEFYDVDKDSILEGMEFPLNPAALSVKCLEDIQVY